MELRLFGMALVLGASVFTGMQAAAAVKRCCSQLSQLRLALELMRCEIACRLTPMRQLSGMLKTACRGELARFFGRMEAELQKGSDVARAAESAKQLVRLRLPKEVQQSLDELFSTFGSYDDRGQLRLIELTQSRVAGALEQLSKEQPKRCRCYEMLGLCAGLALIILAW